MPQHNPEPKPLRGTPTNSPTRGFGTFIGGIPIRRSNPNDNGGLDFALLGTLDYVRHWNLDVVAACNGVVTGWQVFDLPHVQAALPGATRDEKLQPFGAFLQDLAAHELFLFEP